MRPKDIVDRMLSNLGFKKPADEIPEGHPESGMPTNWKSAVEEEAVIEGTLRQANLAYDVEEISSSKDKDLVLHKKQDEQATQPVGNIRIALIQPFLRVVGQVGVPNPYEADLIVSDEASLVVSSGRDATERMSKQRAQQLSQALKSKADIIVVSELGMPCELSQQGFVSMGGSEEEALQQHAASASKLLERAKSISKSKQEAFIVFGSAHCLETHYNIATIYPGSYANEGWLKKRARELPIAGKSKRVSKIEGTGPISQVKVFPARRAGEMVKLPCDPVFRLYRHSIGRIAVLVCSDVIDLNQFIRIVNINSCNEGVDRINMVLVPSFNMSRFLTDTCKNLSAAASTIVVVVNARGEFATESVYGSKALEPSQIFFDGHPKESLEHAKIIRKLEVGGDDIDIYDIDILKIYDIIVKTAKKQRQRLLGV